LNEFFRTKTFYLGKINAKNFFTRIISEEKKIKTSPSKTPIAPLIAPTPNSSQKIKNKIKIDTF